VTPFSRTRCVRRAIAAVAALTAAVFAAGCQSGGAVAATVNGQAISQSSVDSELHAIGSNNDYVAAVEQSQPVRGKGNGTFDLAFTDSVLTRQILLALVHQEVQRRHVVITPAEIKSASDSTRAQLTIQQPGQQSGKDVYGEFPPGYQALLARRAAEVQALQNALANVSIDDAAVQKYYAANAKQFSQTCVSHILVTTQAQADQLRAQIVAGADFAAAARQSSTDKASGVKGGDLGCNAAGTFVTEFETAMNGLAIGQLSPVVHTQFGYHLIKVTDRKVMPLSQARSQIIKQLQSQGSTQLTQYLQTAVAKAKVTVSSRYGTWNPSSSQPGVVPPNAPPARAGGQPATTVQTPTPGSAPTNQVPPTSTP
jgi:parvulin-like peptidyl-prolyl isomerase